MEWFPHSCECHHSKLPETSHTLKPSGFQTAVVCETFIYRHKVHISILSYETSSVGVVYTAHIGTGARKKILMLMWELVPKCWGFQVLQLIVSRFIAICCAKHSIQWGPSELYASLFATFWNYHMLDVKLYFGVLETLAPHFKGTLFFSTSNSIISMSCISKELCTLSPLQIESTSTRRQTCLQTVQA